MNCLDYTYRGKIISCHTQAIFNAFFSKAKYNDYLLFEALTTNPFGVKFIKDDSNRVLDAFLDLDLGLDRALDILNIEYRVLYFDNDSDEVMSVLKSWLKKNYVVVGPLNMQDLGYLYYPQLYTHLDHYLTLLKYDNNKFYFLDSEGISYISLTEQEFIKAWRGDNVIEGRGSFMMRQILEKKEIKLDRKSIKKTFSFILDNLYLAQIDSAYKILSKISIEKNNYLKKSLTYAIPNRLQRIFIQKEFFKVINIKSEIDKILNIQIDILNQILFDILENNIFSLFKFKKLDLLEDKIIEEIEKMVIQL